MVERYSKTEKGRIEIRTRALTLSRTARNLLLIIDSSRSLPEWLAMVQGSNSQDGAALIEAGLIEAIAIKTGGDNKASTRPPVVAAVPVMAANVAAAKSETVEDAPASSSSSPKAVNLGYVELYDGLNALVKETLGLFKGYRFSLDIERARDLQELQVVAQRFVEEVAKTRGESVARVVRRALGL